MPSRPLCRWVLWVLALWVSVLTPLAALGCVQACERAWGDGRCCASETTRPCSNHPCSCEPCPVCSAPAPSPLWAKAEEPKPLSPASCQHSDHRVRAATTRRAADAATRTAVYSPRHRHQMGTSPPRASCFLLTHDGNAQASCLLRVHISLRWTAVISRTQSIGTGGDYAKS
jgi:hypothetical protein